MLARASALNTKRWPLSANYSGLGNKLKLSLLLKMPDVLFAFRPNHSYYFYCNTVNGT